MSSSQFWVGMLVPPFLKWASPRLRKFFKLEEFDAHTRERITTKQYPSYFSFLYGLWILALLASGIIVLLFFMIYGQTLFPDKNYAVPVFLGLINMIGAWFIFGALLDGLFWRISSACEACPPVMPSSSPTWRRSRRFRSRNPETTTSASGHS